MHAHAPPKHASIWALCALASAVYTVAERERAGAGAGAGAGWAGTVHRARAVIVTASLGVLRAGGIEFEPPLPSSKARALGRLGFGALNKVALVFSTAFWLRPAPAVGAGSGTGTGSGSGTGSGAGSDAGEDDDDADNPSDIFGCVQAGDRGLFYMFYNLTGILGRPALVALISGEAAAKVEAWTDAALVEGALAVLRRTFGADRVGAPLQAAVSRWATDGTLRAQRDWVRGDDSPHAHTCTEYCRGSYSSIPPGAVGSDYDDMAAPVGDRCTHRERERERKTHAPSLGLLPSCSSPKTCVYVYVCCWVSLFFAGEATNRQFPATVHGAYMSGLREATRVLDLLRPVRVSACPCTEMHAS
jgi:hypothetical protein